MNITPIDDLNNLFAVKDVLTEELLRELSQVNLIDVPWEHQKSQEDKNRRSITVEPNSIFDRIDRHIDSKKSIVEEALAISIEQIWSVFWLDLETFRVSRHIDNPSVTSVLQVYLTNNESSPTIFYDVDESLIKTRDTPQKYYYEDTKVPTIRHQFDCMQNTGYMMVNGKTQLHGNPDMYIGPNEQRLSVYCHIIEKTKC